MGRVNKFCLFYGNVEFKESQNDQQEFIVYVPEYTTEMLK